MKPGYNCLTREEYMALTAPRRKKNHFRGITNLVWKFRLALGLL